MKQRSISAFILLSILIVCISISDKIFDILMLVIAVLGFNELFEIKFHNKKEVGIIKIGGIISLMVIVLNNAFYQININVTILFPLLFLTLPIIFYNDSNVYNIVDSFYVIGIVYLLGLSFENIIMLRNTEIAKCIYIFIIAFITDTYAYIGGSLIGRHKLTSISPKKTIEGSLIGIVFGVIFGVVYYHNMIGDITIFRIVMLSLFLTLMSEIGDLLFSSIKRYFNKKDYSNLIPGHGGILDRFDSVIYVSLMFMIINSLI